MVFTCFSGSLRWTEGRGPLGDCSSCTNNEASLRSREENPFRSKVVESWRWRKVDIVKVETKGEDTTSFENAIQQQRRQMSRLRRSICEAETSGFQQNHHRVDWYRPALEHAV